MSFITKTDDNFWTNHADNPEVGYNGLGWIFTYPVDVLWTTKHNTNYFTSNPASPSTIYSSGVWKNSYPAGCDWSTKFDNSFWTNHPSHTNTSFDSGYTPVGNPIVGMNFDGANGGTTFTDTYGHTITNTGSVTTSTTQSKFGSSSVYFNGSNYLTIPVSLGSGDWTIEFWYYMTNRDTNAYNTVLLDIGNSYMGTSGFIVRYYPWFASNGITITNNSGGGVNPTATAVNDINFWNHIAIVKSINGVRLCVNGNSWSGYLSNPVSFESRNSIKLGYGSSYYPYQRPFYMDDLLITPGTAKYTGNFTPPTRSITSGVVQANWKNRN